MNRFQDDVGGAHRPSPYEEGGAIDRDCPTCLAKPGEKCTFEASFKGERRTRHCPCLRRLVVPKTPDEESA